jgi:hypothetical protein
MMFLYPNLVDMAELGSGPLAPNMKAPDGIGGLEGIKVRVTLGGYPPRVPTDPYVHALEHTVPQVEGSLRDRER